MFIAEPALAQEQGGEAEKGMQKPMYSSSPNMNWNTSEESQRCAELARKVQQLKGRPQQRYVAQQRYEAECMAPDGNYSR